MYGSPLLAPCCSVQRNPLRDAATRCPDRLVVTRLPACSTLLPHGDPFTCLAIVKTCLRATTPYQALSNTAWAYAHMDHRHYGLLTALFDQVRWRT